MPDSTVELITSFAFVSAILKEMEARDPGFANAVFKHVEADIEQHAAIATYREELTEGLNIIRSEIM